METSASSGQVIGGRAGAADRGSTVATTTATIIPSEQALAARRDPERQPLRHVMIVGGTLGEWHDLGDSRWSDRVDELGGVAAHAGASFLTVRAYEPGDDPVDLPRWTRQVGECLVIVDPCGDGRQRFADAVATIPSHEPINEAVVSEVLYAPADCEPDLIVVLGEPTQLPPSVVWELAYGELVFHPLGWDELSGRELVDAIADFATRDRRFGGIEDADDAG